MHYLTEKSKQVVSLQIEHKTPKMLP